MDKAQTFTISTPLIKDAVWIVEHLRYKFMQMHECIFNTVATDALVLKHQPINTHNADWIFIILDQFYAEIFKL